MKRRALIQYLEQNGCALLREGGRHSVWGHLILGTSSAVPRHAEIKGILVRKICRDLEIPVPSNPN